MRTTVTIDDDVLDAAKEIASAQSRSLGVVLSDLARRGLAPSPRVVPGAYGFPVVVSSTAHAITSQDVAEALDDW